MTEKVDPKEYEAAWETFLDCVDGDVRRVHLGKRCNYQDAQRTC